MAQHQQSPEPVVEYHKPPPDAVNDNSSDGDYYGDNWTVFGKILRGEIPARCLAETPQLLAFEDIRPRATVHALVIPKEFIGSVFDLTASDLPLLDEMRRVATNILAERLPSDMDPDDFRLCFHVPPFNSVDHLHLHVLAPVSHMHPFYRYVKYNPQLRWSTSLDDVVGRLERGLPAVPYRRPYRAGKRRRSRRSREQQRQQQRQQHEEPRQQSASEPWISNNVGDLLVSVFE